MSTQTSRPAAPDMSTPSPATDPGHPQEQLEVEERNPTDDRVYPSGTQLYLVTTSMILTLFLTGLDLTIVAPCVPSLTNEFHTIADIGWYSSVTGFVGATFGFFFGKAYTVYSIKKVFLTSLAIFELGSLLCTVAPTSKAFILGRAILGFGSSGVGLGCFTIITQCFPLEKRPIWTGIAGASQGVGLVSAPIIGGALIDALSWRACFGINLPLGVPLIGLIAYFFKDPVRSVEVDLPWKEKIKRLDLLSTAIFVPAIACLLLALQIGGSTNKWNTGRVIALFVVSAFLLVIFGWLQHRGQDAAILPPRVLNNRNILAGSWFTACCNGGLAMTEYYIAIYFQGVKGFSAAKSGVMGVPMIVGLLLATVSSGFGVSKLGYYNPFMIVTTVVAAIAGGILTTLNIDENLLKVLLCLGALGFGIGLGIGQPINAVQTVLPEKDVPIGIAVLGFGGGMGSALFLAVSAALFQNRLVEEIHHYSPSTNTTQIEHVGLSDIRKVIGGDRLRDVLLGYDKAVVQTLYLPVALMVLSIIGPAVMEWRSVKKKQS
jgi:MFS family permease